MSVDGEVTSAQLGVDLAAGAWLGGVMLAHASADGSYRGGGGPGTGGRVSVTAVHPYVGVDLNERVSAWAVAGLGLGGAHAHAGGGAGTGHRPDPGAGRTRRARAVWWEPAGGSGFSLAIESDGYWVRTNTAAAPGRWRRPEADATRLRLGLDGGYRLALAGGGTLAPTIEVGRAPRRRPRR